MAAGWGGAWALLWARRVSAVRTLRLDADQDVAVLRFVDEQYARDFKKANSKATSKALTEAPAFFARPSFWKVVFVLGLVAFIAHKVAHAAVGLSSYCERPAMMSSICSAETAGL